MIRIFYDIIIIMIMERLKTIAGDILGGLNASIIALPQALAFGAAAGLGAAAGIWGTIVLCFTSALFIGRTPLISGVTGPVTIVIASIFSAINMDISSILLIIMLSGIFQVILALTPFASIIKYIPYPVMSGFLNGIGIIIILMQLNPLIGLPLKSNTITSTASFLTNFHMINFEALILGILTLLIIFLIPGKFNKVIPSQILALVICTYISIKFNFNIERISVIPGCLPALKIPEFNINNIISYMDYAIVLTVVLSTESLLTVSAADSLLKTKTSSKKMLIGQGIGNILCSLTGSLPGSAATMRTVAAINAGAVTKLAAFISSFILVILLLKLSGFVSQIPLAVLAGILIKIGYDIIDLKLLKVLKYAPKEDLCILWLVFILTVFYNLVVAIGAGITGAAVLYAKKIADKTKLVHKVVYDDKIVELEKDLDKNYHHKIRVVHIEGQFFFGSATRIVAQFEEILGTEFLILDYSSGDLLDISAIFALEDIIVRLQSQHVKTALVLNSEDVLNQLKKHNIVSQLGENNVFISEYDAIEYAKLCLQK